MPAAEQGHGRHVLIRADASSAIGVGHIMRCLALAHSLRKINFRPRFSTHCTNPQLLGRITAESFEVHTHLHDQGGVDDRVATMAMLGEMNTLRSGTPWLVVDGYGFDAAYMSAVMHAGYRVLLFDDYQNRDEYHCDLLLNVNIGAEELRYGPEAERTLLGPEYGLLRPEFLGRTDGVDRSVPLSVNKMLVTVGGADPFNLSQRIMDAADVLGPKVETVVAVGPANPNLESLDANAKMNGRARVESAADMPELMLSADLAVTAGGGTCWELTYMGVPFLVLSWAENQVRTARMLDERGVAVDLGWHSNLTVESVSKQLARIAANAPTRQTMIQRGRQLVDGRGGQRVAQAMLEVP